MTGLAVRMPVSFLVVYGGGFTWKERLFFAFAWSPKVRCWDPPKGPLGSNVCVQLFAGLPLHCSMLQMSSSKTHGKPAMFFWF